MPHIAKLLRQASLSGVALALSAVGAVDTAEGREPVPVTLTNSSALSADIARAQGLDQPVGIPLSCSFNLGTCVTSFPVPASERLVIEFVTASCGSALNSVFSARLTTTVGPNAPTAYDLRLHEQGPGQVISQVVKIYADAGTSLTFTALSDSQIGGCTISLAGQEVSVP
jgi:hypothetical protein